MKKTKNRCVYSSSAFNVVPILLNSCNVVPILLNALLLINTWTWRQITLSYLHTRSKGLLSARFPTKLWFGWHARASSVLLSDSTRDWTRWPWWPIIVFSVNCQVYEYSLSYWVNKLLFLKINVLRNSALQTIFYNWEKSEKALFYQCRDLSVYRTLRVAKSENLCWPIYITTQLIKPKYLVLFPPTRQLSRNLTP